MSAHPGERHYLLQIHSAKESGDVRLSARHAYVGQGGLRANETLVESLSAAGEIAGRSRTDLGNGHDRERSVPHEQQSHSGGGAAEGRPAAPVESYGGAGLSGDLRPEPARRRVDRGAPALPAGGAGPGMPAPRRGAGVFGGGGPAAGHAASGAARRGADLAGPREKRRPIPAGDVLPGLPACASAAVPPTPVKAGSCPGFHAPEIRRSRGWKLAKNG